mmetsp:Transcript_14046/g.34327  ORF Transcript_14046/g.34327 Transcript_14046/m.34327 type:complete len:211 (-) Transcript_14046:205-837(-)
MRSIKRRREALSCALCRLAEHKRAEVAGGQDPAGIGVEVLVALDHLPAAVGAAVALEGRGHVPLGRVVVEGEGDAGRDVVDGLEPARLARHAHHAVGRAAMVGEPDRPLAVHVHALSHLDRVHGGHGVHGALVADDDLPPADGDGGLQRRPEGMLVGLQLGQRRRPRVLRSWEGTTCGARARGSLPRREHPALRPGGLAPQVGSRHPCHH